MGIATEKAVCIKSFIDRLLWKYLYHIYMHWWLRWYACISAVDYYSANSANYCANENGICKCSATDEQCTGLEVCSYDGACEGIHNDFIQIYIVIYYHQ